jgi:hypothetical protein
MCNKLHMKTESLDFLTILLKILEIGKYLKHLRAKDDHHRNIEHSESIDSL